MENPFHTLFSDNDYKNMIFAAILSLLLVLFFLCLLRYYTQHFLALNPNVESLSAPALPIILGARLYRLRDFITDDGVNNLSNLSSSYSTTIGLDSSTIASIPKFVFEPKVEEQGEEEHGLECVICLSLFENGEVGRRIEACRHAFHIECIDMWLYSHMTCPICRAPAVQETSFGNVDRACVVDASSLASDCETGAHVNVISEMDQEIEMGSNFGEIGRISSESSSHRLEITVEIPNAVNELNDTNRKKLHTSPNVCT